MIQQGTATYKTDELYTIVCVYEAIINPLAESLREEWEEWQERSGEELRVLSEGVNDNELRKSFNKLEKGLSETTIKVTETIATNSSLWFKREKIGPSHYTTRGHWGVELAEAIANKLREELPDRHKNNLLLHRAGEGCYDQSTQTHILGVVSGGWFVSLRIKGTIPPPIREKNRYEDPLEVLHSLNQLLKLPNTESVTLSSDQASGLSKLITEYGGC